MPMKRSDYPDDWEAISLSIRRRARGRCECTGECGLHSRRCTARTIKPHPITASKVILTTAHLGIPKPDGTPGDKHDKADCRPENLKAMCQRCHLVFDHPDHVRHAAETRRRKKIEQGQGEMNL